MEMMEPMPTSFSTQLSSPWVAARWTAVLPSALARLRDTFSSTCPFSWLPCQTSRISMIAARTSGLPPWLHTLCRQVSMFSFKAVGSPPRWRRMTSSFSNPNFAVRCSGVSALDCFFEGKGFEGCSSSHRYFSPSVHVYSSIALSSSPSRIAFLNCFVGVGPTPVRISPALLNALLNLLVTENIAGVLTAEDTAQAYSFRCW
mmetsp:Transcript_607/g.1290  ORF Transcript_607/g.1290 Transcript_607/m.1290 type:complete len:202 (-) Transcript_607:34-639(-)